MIDAVSVDEINAHVMAKQHLLPGTRAGSVSDAAMDSVGLHATDPLTPYISLWNRMEGFDREMLDTALHDEKSLVRISAMRGTYFLFPFAMAPVAFSATRYERHSLEALLGNWKLPKAEYGALVSRITALLNDAPMTLEQLSAMIPTKSRRTLKRKVGKLALEASNLWLALSIMEHCGLVISGKCRGEGRVFGRSIYSLPPLNLMTDEPRARKELVKRYIGAYGPVLEDDIAWWVDYTKGEVRKMIEGMDTARLRITGLEGEHVMLREDHERMRRSKGKAKGSIILLPYEDPYTKAYRVRMRLVDDKNDRLFYVGGTARPCIMADGRIAGTWRMSKGRVFHRLFSGHDGRTGEKVDQEAKRLEGFVASLVRKS